MPDRALVLFSGGQDSATCLAWALDRFDHVETIGFSYGQRHSIELAVRARFIDGLKKAFPHWASKLHDDHFIELGLLKQIGGTAMTDGRAIEMGANGLPNTFVPGRNLIFFTAAAAVAYRRELKRLVGGMCETDYSGYPDCRDDTLKALQATLNLGMQSRLVIETPLMWIDKAETFALARQLGGQPLLDLILEHTHTCYNGDRANRHDWGYGCDACPACELRSKGWAKFVAEQVVA